MGLHDQSLQGRLLEQCGNDLPEVPGARENRCSAAGLGSDPGQDVQDGQPDLIPDAAGLGQPFIPGPANGLEVRN